MTGRVHIGTSGWHYQHWRGPFYPAELKTADMLLFYAGRLDTVEINNSFYRLPVPAAVKNWRKITPAKFCFSVKGSRYLTHMKKLKDPRAGLAKFFRRIDYLGKKLGPIVFQLPPGWRCNPDRLAAFLKALPHKHRYSFELRDPSWHNQDVYSLLRRHNAAFCIYELAGFHSPEEITADFAYVRLHGPQGAYQGNYTADHLTAWSRRIRRWQRTLKDVFVYFDNDQSGFAARNAVELQNRVGSMR
jgi:uncharacterized protein YecE (DUF72 family)